MVSNDSSIYTQPTLDLFFKSVFRVLGLKKASKSSFRIFSKNSFRNELHTHPFYPILIPNTPYVKFKFFFILFVGVSLGVKYFCTGCPKLLCAGENKILDFFLGGGASAIKSLEKSIIFQVWVAKRFFALGQKTTEGVVTVQRHTPPPPMVQRVKD